MKKILKISRIFKIRGKETRENWVLKVSKPSELSYIYVCVYVCMYIYIY